MKAEISLEDVVVLTLARRLRRAGHRSYDRFLRLASKILLVEELSSPALQDRTRVDLTELSHDGCSN